MIKQHTAEKLVEFEDSNVSSEAHEIAQLKITLAKTLARLENYMPDTQTYAGSLVDQKWSDLIDSTTALLNYVDSEQERNRPLHWYVDDVKQELDDEAEHIRQESF